MLGVVADLDLAGRGAPYVPGLLSGGAPCVEGLAHVAARPGARRPRGVRQVDGRLVCRLLLSHHASTVLVIRLTPRPYGDRTGPNAHRSVSAVSATCPPMPPC